MCNLIHTHTHTKHLGGEGGIVRKNSPKYCRDGTKNAKELDCSHRRKLRKNSIDTVDTDPDEASRKNWERSARRWMIAERQ